MASVISITQDLFTAGIVKGRVSNPKLMLDSMKSRNAELKELIQNGVGVHHAGMLRSDRNLVEKMFEEGMLKLLVCTATLAWGVNLPAHTVLIKGSQLHYYPSPFVLPNALLPFIRPQARRSTTRRRAGSKSCRYST